ncbi:MAG: Coenzyme F420 hydrogenase/dehydrogenase, beta subunit C-terminal domain, partial [Muribaculaceae bacterium]|nr:Coenzyme F420 hydrogenase/dehydrogenase, beta subunit C-terminal domain [Muribaculaceae bacterium]
MIDICNKDLCTGCSACSTLCPNNAIVMKKNEEGFLYPEINNDLCTNCGLCKKRCPINNDNINLDKPIEFIAAANDKIRETSSSGGIFRIIANYVIKSNGFVCGAVYNENMEVEHILSNNINDILRMSGSKYVQSNIKNCYYEIKEKLKNNYMVLFSGCPCQVAGLKQYLKKDYDNLFTIDLICHGVPSPLVLKKYIEEEYPNDKVIDINFRDKKFGWMSPYTTIKTINKKYSKKFTENTFCKAFSCNIDLRKSCYNCKYTNKNRVGDFTIGDAWGIKNITDNKGYSVVFFHNKKSKLLI